MWPTKCEVLESNLYNNYIGFTDLIFSKICKEQWGDLTGFFILRKKISFLIHQRCCFF